MHSVQYEQWIPIGEFSAKSRSQGGGATKQRLCSSVVPTENRNKNVSFFDFVPPRKRRTVWNRFLVFDRARSVMPGFTTMSWCLTVSALAGVLAFRLGRAPRCTRRLFVVGTDARTDSRLRLRPCCCQPGHEVKDSPFGLRNMRRAKKSQWGGRGKMRSNTEVSEITKNEVIRNWWDDATPG